MPDTKLLMLANGWRARAQELLLRAETMEDADARQKLLGIAVSYEKLAQRIEQEAFD